MQLLPLIFIRQREHQRLSNDANILCLGAFTLGDKVREELVMAFLTNEYVQGGPSQIKIDAYKQYDKER